MPTLRDILIQTGLAWYTNLASSGPFTTHRTPDALHSILPLSLGIPLQMNNSAMIDWLARSLPGLNNYTLEQVGDMPTPMVDEEQLFIFLHLKGTGESDIGPYRNEYLWVLKTTEDGMEIRESWEYVDSELLRTYWKGLNSTEV